MQIRYEEKREDRYFTYADYCTWDDDRRWELIDGTAYLMASPAPIHQKALLNLGSKFQAHLKGKKCQVYVELDVRLNKDKGDDTVVRPDILVVCDPDKIGKTSINGTPDFIIEILSPSTRKHDMTTKFIKYREAAVKELWHVDPDSQTVTVYTWSDGVYIADNYGPTDKITVGILPELTIDMADIFETESEEKENI